MEPHNLFATLGHPARLDVLRLLIRRAPLGAAPGEIGQALGLKPSTLSVHLAALTAAGLARAERHGRSITYTAATDTLGALTDWLWADCCRGRITCPSPETDMTQPLNVLFLCTGNSARSILAEALLNALGQGRLRGFSAGTRPAGQPNPEALATLEREGLPTEGLRSKDLSEFQAPDAPKMDFVFTLCDSAANEECAIWAGHPLSAHWGMPDPAAAAPEARRLAFAQAYAELHRRLSAFTALPFESLSRASLQTRLDALAKV